MAVRHNIIFLFLPKEVNLLWKFYQICYKMDTEWTQENIECLKRLWLRSSVG